MSKDSKYSSEEMKKYFHDENYRNAMKKKSPFKKIWYFLFFFILIIGISSTLYLRYIITGLPSLEELENPKPELATKVYSYDGEVLDQFYLKNRTKITYDKIPQSVIDALIATEDKDFYDHWGVTPWRFIQAMVKNIMAFRLREGASTITQQLARNLYDLKKVDEKFFDKTTRKLREYITSVQIERAFTKKEILEMYLNVVYFGRGAYGISAAASIYFGKDASELTLGESALLVGIVKNPGGYNPLRNPQRAYNRRNVVLGQMLKYQRITETQLEQVKADSLQYKTDEEEAITGIAPHFTEYIRQQLLQKAEKYGFDIYKDGLSVYTTLDSRMQRHANRAVQEHLAEIQPLFNKEWDWSKKENISILKKAIEKNIREKPQYKKATAHQRDSIATSLRNNPAFVDSVKKIAQTIETGVIVIDPRTGEIRAMVGGSNFRSFKYGLNHTTQIKRQPGSSFKPFVFTVAIDNGYPASYEILNQPVTVMLPEGRWTPQNYDNDIGGKYTIRNGIKYSINLVAVRAIMEIAPKEQVVQYAKRMGIESRIPLYESISLGTSLVTPLEMASAYGVYANEGVHVKPTAIIRIEDKNGTVIEKSYPEKKEVLSKETTYLMTSMLQGVVESGGTGSRVRNYFHYPAAGKTGTTQSYADAWFVGYTPQLVASVWAGFDDQQIHFANSDGAGGKSAAPLWGRLMQYIYADKSINLPLEYFQQPSGIIEEAICSETKKLATEFCPNKETEIFNAKYPPQKCDKHTSADSKEENSNGF